MFSSRVRIGLHGHCRKTCAFMLPLSVETDVRVTLLTSIDERFD